MRSDHLSKHKRTHAVRPKLETKPGLDTEEEGEVEDGGAMDEGVEGEEQGGGVAIRDGGAVPVVPIGPPVAASGSGTLLKVQELMPATLAEMQAAEW